MIKIVIPGPPVSFHKESIPIGNGHRIVKDSAGYAKWRDYARGRAAEICEGIPVSDEPFVVTIRGFFLPPKSMSKKLLAMALKRMVRPMKLDVDNFCKAVFDNCLTGIVMRDDKQIVSVTVEKWFDQNPRVEIEAAPWVPTPQQPTFFEGIHGVIRA